LAGRGLADIGRNLWGRFCSSDPGLVQFRLASRSAVSVAVGVAVGYAAAHLTGQPVLIPIMLCAVLSLNISFTVADPTPRARLITVVLMPVPAALGMLLAAILAGHRDAALTGFVVVMFVAVYIRRFGPRFFAYGLVGWMAYFLSMFTGITLAQAPAMLAVVGLEIAAMLVLQVLVFRTAPGKVLARMVRAFHARIGAVADTGLAQLDGARPGGRADRRQRVGLIRLNEAALLIDGQLGTAGSLPFDRAEEAVRHELLAAEFAMGTIVAAAGRLAAQRDEVGPRELATVREALIALRRGDLAAAESAGTRLGALGMDSGSGYAATAAAYRLGAGVLDLVRALENLDAAPAAPGSTGAAPFRPSVVLFNGRLPGAAPLADHFGAEPPAGLRGLLARTRLTTRQAFQVALASGLAIIIGSIINEQRYYWAVLACFMAFTGTATSAETISKAVDRALGTLIGVGVAIFFADLTNGNLIGVGIVILASVLVGFFLMRFTYLLAVVFITTMVAQLYGVLHEFSSGLLLLRLEETAVGAVIGSVVAISFLPTSTRRVTRVARHNLFVAVADLVAATGRQLHGQRGNNGSADNTGEPDDLRASARAADAALQQLLIIARPWTLPALFGSESPFPGARTVRHRLATYSMLAGQARSLAILVHTHPRPGVHLGTALARICDLLASRVRALGEDSSPETLQTGQVSRRLDAIGLTLVSWYGVTREEPRQMLTCLRHLDGISRRIAGGSLDPASEVPARQQPSPADLVTAPATSGAAVPSPAPSPERRCAAIRGLVSGSDHLPVRAVVTLIDNDGRQVRRTETDPDGRYALTPPDEGAYLLVCTPARGAATRTAPRARAFVADGRPATWDIVLPGCRITP